VTQVFMWEWAQKRIELEFYSAVKDAVEATMSRR
jgi:hypothetical protein